MPSLLPRSIPSATSLFFLLAIAAVHSSCCLAAFVQEGHSKPFFTELDGLNPSWVVQRSVRVDFRPLAIKDVKSPRLDVELNYDIEIGNGESVKDISFVIPQAAAVTRLLLDSSSLSFRSNNITAQGAKVVVTDFASPNDEPNNVQQCQFDASIPAGKHRLVVGLHLPVIRAQRNDYAVAYLCPSLANSANKSLKLQYAVPDYWQFSVNDTIQKGTDSQIELASSNIAEAITFAALENYPWDINPKVSVQNIYEFDRRFSITGWIFMTAIAVTSFLAALVVWYQGSGQIAYGSLCLVGVMAVVGLAAAIVLPNQSNQMRVVRQQDHDELVMLANRLLLNQLRNNPESIGEIVDASVLPTLGNNIAAPGKATSQDLSPVLVALMRQSKAIKFGDCFINLEEVLPNDTSPKKSSGIHYVVLRDGPSTVSLYELKSDGDNLTCRLVGTSPVPTTMRIGAAVSDSDVSEFHKDSLDKLLK